MATRSKLGTGSTAEALKVKLETLGFTRIELNPTRGFWLHSTQDCYRWEGHAVFDGCSAQLFSWNTMTQCVRSPIKVERDGVLGHTYEVWVTT